MITAQSAGVSPPNCTHHGTSGNFWWLLASAAESSIGSFEAVHQAKLVDSSVVIVSIIKHKVSQFVPADIKITEDLCNSVGYRFACMSANQLRQRDGKVSYLTLSVREVCDNSKEATFATFSCPAIKADVYLGTCL